MFDTTGSIEVYVCRYGSDRRYAEHFENGRTRVCYIEAVAGERFELRVVVQPTFDVQQQPTVRMRFSIDEGVAVVTRYIYKPKGVWLRPITREVDKYRKNTRKGFSSDIDWCGFQFSEMPHLESQAYLSDARIAQGRIELTFERGQYRRHSKRRRDLFDTKEPKTFKAVPLGKADPLDFKGVFEPDTGPTAERLSFTFHYASRSTLQAKGFLLLSPNSDPTVPQPTSPITCKVEDSSVRPVTLGKRRREDSHHEVNEPVEPSLPKRQRLETSPSSKQVDSALALMLAKKYVDGKKMDLLSKEEPGF